MAVEPVPDRPRVFFSYSRGDSEFAYRLRADLEASGFATWIDTAKLGNEGGQEWLRIIQDAVDSCQAMVVIVSPASVQSRYVHMEYHRAQTHEKLVIPLHYQTVTNAPIDLELDQWIEFRAGQGRDDWYQAGLANLIRSLGNIPEPLRLVSLPSIPETAPLTISEGADIPEFGPVPPLPSPPPADIQDLIAGAYDARARDDLAGEEHFLRRIVESADASVSPAFADRLKIVSEQVVQLHTARLREIAHEAVQHKQWRRALGAWQALLDVLPNDPAAQEGIREARRNRAQEAVSDGEFDEAVGAWQALQRLDPSQAVIDGLRSALRARADDAWKRGDWSRAAESWEALRSLNPPEEDADEYLQALAQNRRVDYLYQLAQQFILSENAAAARPALEDVYRSAPYYGDPGCIAPAVGIQPPPTREERRQQAAEEAERRRRAAEAAEEAERLRLAAEEAERERRAIVAEILSRRPRYRSGVLKASLFSAWLSAFGASVAAGVIVGLLTKGWQYTLPATALAAATTAILSYSLGYRRALPPLTLIPLIVIASTAAFGVVWVAPQLPDATLRAFQDPDASFRIVQLHSDGSLFAKSLGLSMGKVFAVAGFVLGPIIVILAGMADDASRSSWSSVIFDTDFGCSVLLGIGIPVALLGTVLGAVLGIVAGIAVGGTVGYFGWLLAGVLGGAFAGVITGLISIGTKDVGVSLLLVLCGLVAFCAIVGVILTTTYNFQWDVVYLWAGGTALGMLGGTGVGATAHILLTPKRKPKG